MAAPPSDRLSNTQSSITTNNRKDSAGALREKTGFIRIHPPRQQHNDWHYACVLLFDTPLDKQPKTSQVLCQVGHDLEAAGHQVFFVKQTRGQMDFEVGRIARHIGDNPADAWIVVSGSRNLLEWLAAHIRWDSMPIIRRVGRWVAAVKLGRADHRTINCPPEFVADGSIGPARNGKLIHPS